MGVDLRTFLILDPRHYLLSMLHDRVSVNTNVTWVTYISNVLSNKTILFDVLDFWCQLVVIRFVKTLSKRRMFVSSMKISACWVLHRLIKFNKISWEKRPAKTRPNLRTSFCRRDLKNTQPHLNENCRIFQFKGLSTWPILKFVGKDILKFVGNCRRALSKAWLISGGRLPETRGGFSAEC